MRCVSRTPRLNPPRGTGHPVGLSPAATSTARMRSHIRADGPNPWLLGGRPQAPGQVSDVSCLGAIQVGSTTHQPSQEGTANVVRPGSSQALQFLPDHRLLPVSGDALLTQPATEIHLRIAGHGQLDPRFGVLPESQAGIAQHRTFRRHCRVNVITDLQLRSITRSLTPCN